MSDSRAATVGVDVMPDGSDWYGRIRFQDHADFEDLEIVMLPITNAVSENEAMWNTMVWVRKNILHLYNLRQRMLARKILKTHVVNITTGHVEDRVTGVADDHS